VLDARTPRGVLRPELEQHVDERAGLEILATEPLVEGVEDGEQLLLRAGPTPPRLRLDPPDGPALLTPFEEGDDEVVLRRKVAVERRLGDASTLNDLVYADGANAAAREQLVGSVQNAVAGRCWAGHGLVSRGHVAPSLARLDRPVSPVL
jgi:hypothetical protein